MSTPERLTTFTRDGLVFDVVDSGPPDGPPVVLLHGFPQTSSSWAEVTVQLNAAGYRTFAPDQRGYSPRARPRGRRPYRVAELVADVVALLDEVARVGGDDGPVQLVGHDWGSMVAWAVAGVHPDRVRALTAVSVPHPAAFVAAMRSGTQALRSFYMGFFQLPVVPELLLSMPGPLVDRGLAGMGMSPAAVRRYHSEMVAGGALRGGLGWYRALPFRSRVGRCRVPVTMVWSSGDVAIGRRGIELCPRYVTGDYRLVELPGSHWIPEEHPDAVVEAVTRAG